jgi:3-deoxy-7-phosphoheptulonate synthase
MKIKLIQLLFLPILLVNSWSKSSWRTKIIRQIPQYKDEKILNSCEEKLSKLSPLVFAGECDNLQNELAKISNGQGFLLMGGDCSESFKDFSTDRIRDTYRLILQMGMILTYGSGLPTTKIGRIAGQFAKPRSDEFELVDDKKVLTYRGDIINSLDNREPDPERMLEAYFQSTQTLNILRAFSHGGYANINSVHAWNMDFVEKTKSGSKYRKLADKVTHSLNFVKGLGVNIEDDKFKSTNLYTGHECLLLNYEEALTRNDSRSGQIYDCSAHLVWLGERTRQLDSAHVEFLRGIRNPIGIKLSEKTSSNELVDLINILNPSNTPGRIVLITRMGGDKLKEKLPELIRVVQNNAFNVVWCCDPMHGNTYKTKSGIKTRKFDDILYEVLNFFTIHKKMGSFPGGIHLELTPDNVTECIGGDIDTINENDLNKLYSSQCDPRLNGMQALELAFFISELNKKNKL